MGFQTARASTSQPRLGSALPGCQPAPCRTPPLRTHGPSGSVSWNQLPMSSTRSPSAGWAKASSAIWHVGRGDLVGQPLQVEVAAELQIHGLVHGAGAVSAVGLARAGAAGGLLEARGDAGLAGGVEALLGPGDDLPGPPLDAGVLADLRHAVHVEAGPVGGRTVARAPGPIQRSERLGSSCGAAGLAEDPHRGDEDVAGPEGRLTAAEPVAHIEGRLPIGEAAGGDELAGEDVRVEAVEVEVPAGRVEAPPARVEGGAAQEVALVEVQLLAAHPDVARPGVGLDVALVGVDGGLGAGGAAARAPHPELLDVHPPGEAAGHARGAHPHGLLDRQNGVVEVGLEARVGPELGPQVDEEVGVTAGAASSAVASDRSNASGEGAAAWARGGAGGDRWVGGDGLYPDGGRRTGARRVAGSVDHAGRERRVPGAVIICLGCDSPRGPKGDLKG